MQLMTTQKYQNLSKKLLSCFTINLETRNQQLLSNNYLRFSKGGEMKNGLYKQRLKQVFLFVFTNIHQQVSFIVLK